MQGVSDLADSGLVVRLTRSRAWIGLLATLLAGIVALNVLSLSLSAEQSRVAAQTEALERENSALRADLTDQLSHQRVQSVASRLGLTVPEPGAIRYLSSTEGDAELAVDRLRSEELVAASIPAAPVEAAPAPIAPAEPAPTAPVAAPPAPIEPTTETASPAPAASPTAAGGVATG